MLAKEIIAQMPDDIRARAQAKADKAGQTLDEFVQGQISAQLSDEELDAVSGGLEQLAADFSVAVRVDHGTRRGTTGGIVAGIRF